MTRALLARLRADALTLACELGLSALHVVDALREALRDEREHLATVLRDL